MVNACKINIYMLMTYRWETERLFGWFAVGRGLWCAPPAAPRQPAAAGEGEAPRLCCAKVGPRLSITSDRGRGDERDSAHRAFDVDRRGPRAGPIRRGGRVAEGARLESVFTGNRNGGSDPPPPPPPLSQPN